MMRKWIIPVVAAAFLFSAAHGLEFGGGAFGLGKPEIVVSGLQRWARLKHKDGLSDKTTYRPTAGAVAFRFGTEQFITGLSVSYEGGAPKHEITFLDGPNVADAYLKTQDRTLGFTLFGKYRMASGFNITGSAYMGLNWLKLKDGSVRTAGRPTEFLHGAGSKSSTQFGASLEVGKDFDLAGGFRLTPHVGVDYSFAPKSKLRFSALDGGVWRQAELPVDIPRQNFWEIPFGVTFAKDFACGDWMLKPSLDLTVVAAVGNIRANNVNYRAGFSSFNGSTWKVYGLGGDHWGGRATLGVTAVKSGRFSVGLNYSFEGRRSFHDHRLSANLGFSF